MSSSSFVDDPRLDRLFAAVADPTRRAILTRLERGPATVSELAGPFDMSLPAVSKHLGVLERAGLLERERRGRELHCRARVAPLREAEDWLAERRRFWTERLEALRNLVDADPSEDDAKPQPRRKS